MNINVRNDGGINCTPISNLFIDNYIKGANPAFVVVYIYALRYAIVGSSIDLEKLSEELGLLSSDIIKAFEYWRDKKIVEFEKKDDTIDLTFLSIQKACDEPKEIKKIKLPKRDHPNYTVEEIGCYMGKTPEIKELFSMCERILGKYLTGNDRNVILGIYDWLGMPMEVIAVLCTYCAESGHRSLRYIEKIAIDWVERGIDTEEKADEYIRLYNTDYRKIMKAFGLSNRQPLDEEQEYMQKWLKEYKLNILVISEGCKRSVMSTGKASFPYADKILTSWHEQGVNSIESVKELDIRFAEDKKNEKEKKQASDTKQNNVAVVKQNKFVNYTQRKYDPDKLRQLELDILEHSLEDLDGDI